MNSSIFDIDYIFDGNIQENIKYFTNITRRKSIEKLAKEPNTKGIQINLSNSINSKENQVIIGSTLKKR
ncbi:7656_t:CDS:1, partial [Acaulospora morrowiae]